MLLVPSKVMAGWNLAFPTTLLRIVSLFDFAKADGYGLPKNIYYMNAFIYKRWLFLCVFIIFSILSVSLYWFGLAMIFNKWFKCAFLFSLWPMTFHLSVLWLAVSAYSALGGTYTNASSHTIFLVFFSIHFFFFFHKNFILQIFKNNHRVALFLFSSPP